MPTPKDKQKFALWVQPETLKNDGLKYLAFDKLRIRVGIETGVLVGVSHAGAEFVRQSYLTKYFRNRWIFGIRSELRRIKHSPAMRPVAIFGEHLVAFNHELRDLPRGIIPISICATDATKIEKHGRESNGWQRTCRCPVPRSSGRSGTWKKAD